MRIKGLPHGMERDPDAMNMKLWKRKQWMKRNERNETKKFKKQYIKEKEKIEKTGGLIVTNEQAKDELINDPKKQEFYNQLFKKDDAQPDIKVKKAKKSKLSQNE